ncbi:MAG: phosphopantothenoylcysteine decarboxylase [Phycisphaerae bacterium]|nr:phosphopantothenoylcysteine decarboxylase [Phycisphaerae bacterium]
MADSTQPAPPEQDLGGYELLLAVTGGIAAYKVATVASKLVQRGCGVTVAMTEAATRFVGPVTFQALTGRRVFTSLWDADERHDHSHIRLTEAADLLAVAPATANIIGKIATGIADDLVSTSVLSADSPVLLAPAMNDRMWGNPIVQQNVERLRSLDYHFVGPKSGWLSCRARGIGRMAEPETIIETIAKLLTATPPKSARTA